MILSICIPSYNRTDCLENCLNSILISSKNVRNFEFEVSVSDNFSDQNPIDIIKKYQKYFKINFKRNKRNLGFALNAIETVQMSSGKYIWIIGNDDLILPQTLNNLKNIFQENQNIKYFFVNSYYLNSEFLNNFPKPFDTNNLEFNKLKPLSKIKKNKEVGFWEIIDPKVSWEFLIGIFLSISERTMWIDGLKFIDKEQISDPKTWSNFDNTCLNAKIICNVFKNSKSYQISNPLSVNLIGEREWVSLYEFVEIVRIPELIDYYRSQGMSLAKYIYCKNFALRNFFNFFFKIFIHGKKAGRQYVNLKKHFFFNLIYPNAWLSIFYYVTRTLKKYLKQ